MTAGETPVEATPSYYQPLIPSEAPQYVVVLPPYPLRRFRRRRSYFLRPILITTAVLILAAAGYLFFPSDPEISVVQLSLDRLHFHTTPTVSLDVTLSAKIEVHNRDFYSIEYDQLVVGIGYRGEKLGFMTSRGGKIKARGKSFVDATVTVDGVEVLGNLLFFLEDLARGEMEFDTVSEVKGKMELLFLRLPFKAKGSCEAIVSTRNQTITHQNCYPEF